jgi:hypothetical protein
MSSAMSLAILRTATENRTFNPHSQSPIVNLKSLLLLYLLPLSPSALFANSAVKQFVFIRVHSWLNNP